MTVDDVRDLTPGFPTARDFGAPDIDLAEAGYKDSSAYGHHLANVRHHLLASGRHCCSWIAAGLERCPENLRFWEIPAVSYEGRLVKKT